MRLQPMKRRTIFWVLIVAGAGALTILFSARRNSSGLFSPISPFVYRHRSALSNDKTLGAFAIEAYHLKGISPAEAERLLKDDLLKNGYSKASAPSNPTIVYDHPAGPNQAWEIEIDPGSRYGQDGTVIMSYRPVTTSDLVIGRINHLGRNPVLDQSELGDSPMEFLGE